MALNPAALFWGGRSARPLRRKTATLDSSICPRSHSSFGDSIILGIRNISAHYFPTTLVSRMWYRREHLLHVDAFIWAPMASRSDRRGEGVGAGLAEHLAARPARASQSSYNRKAQNQRSALLAGGSSPLPAHPPFHLWPHATADNHLYLIPVSALST